MPGPDRPDREDGSGAPPPGLCATCAWARIIATDRGTRFYLCRRSEQDPRFPRYPRLPVIACRGWEPR
jgi:hypothetical protein